MLKTIIATFRGPQQTKEAVEEIQGESLANSRISVVVRSNYLHQGDFQEEYAHELLIPVEKTFDRFNAWLVLAPPFSVPDLGEIVAAGPLAGELMKQPQGHGFAHALLKYGLTEERAFHYEHKVRSGHFFVLIQTEHEKANSVANALQNFGGQEVEKWSKEIEHPTYPLH